MNPTSIQIKPEINAEMAEILLLIIVFNPVFLSCLV